MRDKRPVDELSIEELERVLAIRKREARLAQLRRYEGAGRIVGPGEKAPIVFDTAETLNPPIQDSAPQPVEPAKTNEDTAPYFEDELDAQRQKRLAENPDKRTDGKSGGALLWNRLLLLVEIAAVVGLVYLLAGLLQSFQAVSQASADIQSQSQATAFARLIPPTATPVINIGSVVLPVGHVVNVKNDIVVSYAFNLDEVPAQYRDQFRTLVAQSQIQPAPSAAEPVRMQVPKIKVDSTVLVGDTWNELQRGVGHHIGSVNPGERGNMVLSAHNDIYNEIFKDLDKLEPGDTVTVSTTTKDYTYVVQGRQIVAPTDVWVLESRGDSKQLTLISCYPYRVDTKRIVVFATLQS
ncbi:MAG: class D sortase [Chloroflexota bacterium]